MCCDSPSVPQADPRIGEAAAANADVAREALAFQRQMYEEAKPRQAQYQDLANRVVDQQLRLGDKNEAAADDYLNYMKTVFRPAEQALAAEAMSFNTEARRAELAGRAAADVEQSAALADDAARRMAARYGVNPGDAAFTQSLAGNALNKTALKVGAMQNARTAARAEGRAFQFDVAGLGRNLPGAGATASSLALDDANAALGAGAAPAANARSDAALALQGMGTAVGANTAAGNLYGNIFAQQMAGYNAQQQAQAGLFGGLGTLGGMGLSAWLKPAAIASVGIA